MFKITITQVNSKGKEQIIDVKLCETRDEAEQFIKDCKALPKEYRPTEKAPTCFYEKSLVKWHTTERKYLNKQKK